jgi:cobalt/nickel transport system permease protein
MRERQTPLAGIAAAFIFAAQMINFPVAAGTTGHLIGATLAAILLGPHIGAIVVTVVVVVQALVFADGGLTALGYNVLNMAVVPAYGGYAAFRLLLRVMPPSRNGVVGAAGLAAMVSIVLSAMAFSIEWLFGATAPVSFAEVFTAMVGTHLLIGVGEGVISALTIGAVIAARPDLVYNTPGLGQMTVGSHRAVRVRTVVIGAFLAALLLAAVVSQFSADAPDGLERVALDTGIAEEAGDHALAGSIFAGYATAGLKNDEASLAVAGVAGSFIVLAVGSGLFLAMRATHPDRSTG